MLTFPVIQSNNTLSVYEMVMLALSVLLGCTWILSQLASISAERKDSSFKCWVFLWRPLGTEMIQNKHKEEKGAGILAAMKESRKS